MKASNLTDEEYLSLNGTLPRARIEDLLDYQESLEKEEAEEGEYREWLVSLINHFRENYHADGLLSHTISLLDEACEYLDEEPIDWEEDE